jgi:hypothetical protein
LPTPAACGSGSGAGNGAERKNLPRSRGCGSKAPHRLKVTADVTARIGTMTATMVPVPIAEAVQMKRLIEFASDISQLASKRPDLELHRLIAELHAGLIELKEEG